MTFLCPPTFPSRHFRQKLWLQDKTQGEVGTALHTEHTAVDDEPPMLVCPQVPVSQWFCENVVWKIRTMQACGQVIPNSFVCWNKSSYTHNQPPKHPLSLFSAHRHARTQHLNENNQKESKIFVLVSRNEKIRNSGRVSGTC